MSEYIFTNHTADAELERLQLVERTFDKSSRDLLFRAGISTGQSCLDVGAGAGSILRFMADRVTGVGRVTGVDRDIRFLTREADYAARIIQDDILTVDSIGPFDIIHVRYVLIHNKNPEAILKRLVGWLKPGGRLVVAEPDFTAARYISGGDHQSQGRVNDAMCSLFRSKGLDPAFGKSLALHLHRAGLDIVSQRTVEHLCHGGEGPARVMELSSRALAEDYKATTLATDADLEGYRRNALNPACLAIYHSTVSAIAVKPAAL